MKYNFYEDPGHGWLKVTIAELNRLGIADKISGSSYKRGEYAYLEEDCDATLFFEEKAKRHEIVDTILYIAKNKSRIRNYENYRLCR